MKKVSIFLLLSSVVLLSMLGTVASFNPSYTVYGVIETVEGNPIQDASVTVTNTDTNESLNTTTGSEGKYQVNLGNLPSGWSIGDTIDIEVSFDDVTVNDNFTTSGNRKMVDFELTFSDPVAIIIFTPETVFVGDVVEFDGSSSWSNGTITNWNWIFGDDDADGGVDVTHVYDEAGVYEVSLAIVDNYTMADTHSINITVLEPFWSGSASYEVRQGVDRWIDISENLVSDASVECADSRVSFVVENSTLLLSFNAGDTNTTLQLSITKEYIVYQHYITIVVVEVFSATLSASNINSSGLIEIELSINGGKTPYSIVWDWGDGNYTNLTTNLIELSSTHNYSSVGNYSIVSTVTDDDEYSVINEYTITFADEDEDDDSAGNTATVLTENQKKQVSAVTITALEVVLVLFMTVFLFMVVSKVVEMNTTKLVFILLIISGAISLLYGWIDLFRLLAWW